jgi:acyl-coenzyme A thioesterase PaaI-like protein
MGVESCENRHTRLRLDVDHTHLSRGGKISRRTMMLLADTAVYAAILSTMVAVVLSETTN